ncbi:MAG: hypothetical protein LBS92_02130 [Candidatus Methanoplasma sp.]|jgi:hypothetical protein|nr:hypothetical protein [Candidatus Methanoplasma sp.]
MSAEETQMLLAMSAVLATVITMVLMAVVYRRSTGSLAAAKQGRKAGIGLYSIEEGEAEKKCGICYGEIGEEAVSECPCGKLFHDSCAAQTGPCPYCGSVYDHFTRRLPKRSECPVCGVMMRGSICVCGAVFPRPDGTFLCSCGNRVDSARPVCRKCGAAYERATMQTYKNKK